MKFSVNQWFDQQKARRGVLAGGLRTADSATAARVWEGQFTAAGVENALRCVADIFRVFELNGIPPARLRLSYRNGWLHCELGVDGSCLGVLTVADSTGYDAAGLDNLLQEYRVLSSIKRR